jgi:hypothetical protein
MHQHLKKASLILLPLASMAMTSQAEEIVWIDFGSSSAQTSGNWNNVTSINTSGDKADLINSAGDASGISMNISNGSFSGIENYNGDVDADASMFAPFQAGTVITDAAWVNSGNTATLTFAGLDSSLTYNLTIVGARDNANERFSLYTVSGFGSETLQTSGDDPYAGTTGEEWNNNDVVTIGGITGAESFDLTIVGNSAANFSGSNAYSYINALQISVVPEPSAAAALLGLCAIGVTCLRRRRA